MWEIGHFHIQDGLGFWIPWAVDSGLQVLDSSLCQWNWDSGFQSLVGFRIPKAVFRIPKPRIHHFLTLGDPNLGAKYSRNCLLSASYPDVSLLMKMCAQRKAGRKQRARRLAVEWQIFKMAARVMADQYAIFKISSALFICEFWANHCLSTSCVWRGSCFHPTHWTHAS